MSIEAKSVKPPVKKVRLTIHVTPDLSRRLYDERGRTRRPVCDLVEEMLRIPLGMDPSTN